MELTIQETIRHEKLMGKVYCKLCGVELATRLRRIFYIRSEGRCPICYRIEQNPNITIDELLV
jgi:hypothetical protein